MATKKDLELPSGQTFEFVVDVLGGPSTIEGYTGSMMVRQGRYDLVPLLTVPEEAFTVNAGTRQVTVRIPGELTEDLNLDIAPGVYDLLLTGPSGDRWRLLEGRVTAQASVTRED